MQPLSLTLKGFRGIRDGLGLDALTLDFKHLADCARLIAIAGANGRGKTTVMDNMHPYLTMPSRAVMAGPGGFSYYDQVRLPENEKDLTWAHEGRRYRSQIVVRLNGRRRTEAFLHTLDDDGRWQPVRLADGCVSDGKVETYTRCVEGVCGSAETFFTSMFSAQGKRQLSTYRNAEIKSLLADLLGQEEIRVLGLKASETARLLKARLSTVRQELIGLDEDRARLIGERQRLEGAGERVAQGLLARQVAQQTLDAALTRQATLAAEREQSQATETRRAQLTAERQAASDIGTQALATLRTREQGEQLRLDRLVQRIDTRIEQARRRRQVLMQSKGQVLDLLAEAPKVQRAIARLPLADHALALHTARVGVQRQRVERLAQAQAIERMAEQRLVGIEREAGKAVLKAQELAHRFGLTSEVPCRGTDLQGQCMLLGDAREARALMPDAQVQITRLASEKEVVRRDRALARQQCAELSAAPHALLHAESRMTEARERVSRLALLSARGPELERARTRLAGIEQELASPPCTAVASNPAGVAPATETAEEQAERSQIAAAREEISSELSRQTLSQRETLNRLDQVLAALPKPFDEQPLREAGRRVVAARDAVAVAEQTHLAAVRDAQALEDVVRQTSIGAARRTQVEARVAHLERELGGWNLFARCMSNDGLIALAIDDAGPTLAGLANDLLLASYGPRFTVSIHTLVETDKGEQREGFDIVVHDGDSGDRKSVALMSGGERVWINECLTRAVALYLAQHSGRCYTTLFCDEADGPLDPERKRMFMAMKREVLRLGGYEREFFVSQTPELTAMADAVIDLDTLRGDVTVSMGSDR